MDFEIPGRLPNVETSKIEVWHEQNDYSLLAGNERFVFPFGRYYTHIEIEFVEHPEFARHVDSLIHEPTIESMRMGSFWANNVQITNIGYAGTDNENLLFRLGFLMINHFQESQFPFKVRKKKKLCWKKYGF